MVRQVVDVPVFEELAAQIALEALSSGLDQIDRLSTMVSESQAWLAPALRRMVRCSWPYGDRERQVNGKSDRGRLRRLVGAEEGCRLPGGLGLIEMLLEGS